MLADCLADVIECRLPPLTLTRGSEDPPPVVDSSGVAAVCCLLCFIHSYSYTANCFSNCSLGVAVLGSLWEIACPIYYVAPGMYCTALHCTVLIVPIVQCVVHGTALHCTALVKCWYITIGHYYRPGLHWVCHRQLG